MEEAIKQIVNTAGWKYLKQLFQEQVDLSRRTINAENAQDIALQYLARVEAEKIVLNAIKKAEQMGIELPSQNNSYK
jgi:hypothetical protein